MDGTISPTAPLTSLAAPERSPRASSSSSNGHSLDLPSLQPLSHAHPLLSSETFDADQFLLSRLHIPLEELRGELRGYLGELREELVQLINEDYEEFISLGTGLRGEEGRLKRLGGPIKEVRREVESVRDVLAEHQDKVQSKLDERAALREEKALLDLLQRLFDTLTRAETLLDTKADEDHSSAKMITRVAGEYTQVVYLVNKARMEGCAIVDVIEERIERIKSRLSKDLSLLLTAELAEPSIPRLKQCLKTYELIEGWEEAEQVFRSAVRSFCRATITSSALTIPTTPVAPITPRPSLNPLERAPKLNADTPLASLYNRVLAQVETYQPLLQLADEISDRFDLFAGVIWPEIANALVDALGGTIFAAGRPDELHKHYTITHAFISQLEMLAPSAHHVVAMRESQSYASFERRWQLPVYFQLRWKEIVGGYENALVAAGPTGTAGGGEGWSLGGTAACWKALKTCWSDDVYIPELTPRFWRLSLQITARLGTHLQSVLDTFNANEDDTTQQDTALRFTASAVSDLDRLKTVVQDLEVVKSLQLQDQLSLPIVPYSDLLLQILTARCIDPLKLVRSIASQFRASPAPQTSSTSASSSGETIKPSYYILTVLKPIHTLFASRPKLREMYGPEWSTQVSESVLTNYASILSSVRKTEDLLRKHRKSKKTGGLSSFFGGGGSSAASASTADGDAEREEERFRNQMRADIHALKADAESLGVQVDEMSSWKELVEVVNRPAE
ncbi:hypothetical protein IAU60_004604 [Kwoniella sp. DSM 27419]